MKGGRRREGGPSHSRVPHWPGGASGVTVGRGYDMRHRTETQVKADLIAAGVSEATAALLAKGAGLTGDAAKKFVKDNKALEITLAQQQKLFEMVYPGYEAEVKRISEKADVVKKYGATDWAKLDPAIKTLLSDLIFRGDYTTESRTFLQALVSANDVAGLAKVMADAANWPGVPVARFKARKEYMEAAAAALKPAKP